MLLSIPAATTPASAAMAVVFVFLVLSAQYESWTLPMAIILIVPMCILSSGQAIGIMEATAAKSSCRSA